MALLNFGSTGVLLDPPFRHPFFVVQGFTVRLSSCKLAFLAPFLIDRHLGRSVYRLQAGGLCVPAIHPSQPLLCRPLGGYHMAWVLEAVCPGIQLQVCQSFGLLDLAF